ncbi:MAG: 7-cyano-7-deazaguanine synthase [Gemmataceae bacterium]|nr:7-cyano-7-deazaguanine synthase [Gemmataceae bacterium]
MTLAVLVSGGLDSAILVGDAVRRGEAVQPLLIRCGLFWEATEAEYLRLFLAAIAKPNLLPLVELEQPVGDLYGNHWSVTGVGVPSADDPDEDVFLPGRNVLLLAKSLLWCHLHRVERLALGSLSTNPFPDATLEFFQGFERIVNAAVEGYAKIVLPFGEMKKHEVMRLGIGLPLEHTFSCIRPADGLHCGACNKCQERKVAFADAGMQDPTRYR